MTPYEVAIICILIMGFTGVYFAMFAATAWLAEKITGHRNVSRETVEHKSTSGSPLQQDKAFEGLPIDIAIPGYNVAASPGSVKPVIKTSKVVEEEGVLSLEQAREANANQPWNQSEAERLRRQAVDTDAKYRGVS